MPLYENTLVPVCKNVGSRPYSSFGQESCKPYRTVGLHGGPRLPNLEQFLNYDSIAARGIINDFRSSKDTSMVSGAVAVVKDEIKLSH